jgi:PAS domain S-box-containing protein
MTRIESPDKDGLHRCETDIDALAALILERSQDGFYALDAGWRFVYANRRAYEAWGATCETILGREIWERFPQLPGTRAGRLLREAVEAGVPAEFESLSPVFGRWLWMRVDPLPSGITGVYWRDITDKKRIEEALRIGEERLRIASEIAGLGYWERDLATGVLWSSDRCKANFGLPPACELPYEAVLAAVHPAYREGVREASRRAVRDRTSYEAEYPIIWPDGSVHWISVRGRCLYAEDGTPQRNVGVTQDITARKDAENALRESEHRLALAQEGAGLGVWDWDLATNEIHWSPQMFGVLGLDPEHNAADPYGAWLRVLHPQDREAAHAHAQRFRENPESFTLDFRIVRPDGAVRWILSKGTVLADRDGRAVRAVGINMDITERKRAEEALRDSEQRFRTMLEALPHIAFVLRPDGEMEFWNRQYVAYIGEVRTDLQSRADFHHPEDRAHALAVRAAGVGSGSEYAFEARLRRHDGVYRWHTINVRPLRHDTVIVAWLGTAVDIDDVQRANEVLEQRVEDRTAALDAVNRALKRQIQDRERAETALLQAQKMEAIGQITGGVAHDFNNLLTAVIGCLEMIPLERSRERIAKLSRTALRAAARGASLTQQLLSFARRQTLKPVVADLNTMLVEMEMLLRRGVGEATEVALHRHPGLWPCEVDPAQFQAAVMNLVMNARDAMPQGGRLFIETRNIDRAQPPQGLDLQPREYVALAVRDVGEGMTPEVLARAFEPFFTTKDVGKGSGLGLSMVYGFAKQSGGDVHIESAPGLGTCVTIYLPRSESAAGHGKAEREHENPERGSGNILLVEDDDDVREVSAAILRGLGYRVMVAANGPQALSLLRSRERFDVLFTDVVMPLGMSGLDLARQAQALRPGLKVLLTTGQAGAVDRERSALPVILKPFRPFEISRLLTELMGRSGPAEKPRGALPRPHRVRRPAIRGESRRP